MDELDNSKLWQKGFFETNRKLQFAVKIYSISPKKHNLDLRRRIVASSPIQHEHRRRYRSISRTWAESHHFLDPLLHWHVATCTSHEQSRQKSEDSTEISITDRRLTGNAGWDQHALLRNRSQLMCRRTLFFGSAGRGGGLETFESFVPFERSENHFLDQLLFSYVAVCEKNIETSIAQQKTARRLASSIIDSLETRVGTNTSFVGIVHKFERGRV